MAKSAQDPRCYESLQKKAKPPSLQEEQKERAGLSEEAKVLIFVLSLQFAMFLVAAIAVNGAQP